MLYIAAMIDDPIDGAALCLAIPTLGILARSRLTSYQGTLIDVAFALWAGKKSINEGLLRRYAADHRATPEGCAWLKAAAERQACTLHIAVYPHQDGKAWRLCEGENKMATLRLQIPKLPIKHFKGDQNAERLVRETTGGMVTHYEGERGAERLVRTEFPDVNNFYEGEKGAERVVRGECYGFTTYYEGEKGAERRVRIEMPNGVVTYHEGERGAERLVRSAAAAYSFCPSVPQRTSPRSALILRVIPPACAIAAWSTLVAIFISAAAAYSYR